MVDSFRLRFGNSYYDIGMSWAPFQFENVSDTNLDALRIRQEGNGRDIINSRAWDFFHATPATQVSADGLRSKQGPVHMDMNPIASRTNAIQYRAQPQYIPDPPRVAVAPTFTTPSVTFSQNPYLQRLDAAGSDSRNIIRELRGAVVEDNLEREVEAVRKLSERQFNDRWLAPKAAADAASLQAYELLRPKQDDWRTG
ncbi:MAG: hypothetical protein EBT07_04050 [Actinobacteria bacterium]|nr:hypothetical protein [Actinomycetota bacterium]